MQGFATSNRWGFGQQAKLRAPTAEALVVGSSQNLAQIRFFLTEGFTMKILRDVGFILVSMFLCCDFSVAQDDSKNPPTRETKGKAEETRPQQANRLHRHPQQSNSISIEGSRRNFAHLAEMPGLVVNQNIYRLLNYKSIRRELELLDYQQDDVAAMRRKRAEQRRKRLRAIQTEQKSNSEEQKIAIEETETSNDDVDILLPSQLKRLEQIALQLKIQSTGIFATLTESSVAEKLEITEPQKNQLRKEAAKLAKEYNQQVLKLKRKFREDLMSKLKGDQKQLLQSMLGEEFQLNANPDDEYE